MGALHGVCPPVQRQNVTRQRHTRDCDGEGNVYGLPRPRRRRRPVELPHVRGTGLQLLYPLGATAQFLGEGVGLPSRDREGVVGFLELLVERFVYLVLGLETRRGLAEVRLLLVHSLLDAHELARGIECRRALSDVTGHATSPRGNDSGCRRSAGSTAAPLGPHTPPGESPSPSWRPHTAPCIPSGGRVCVRAYDSERESSPHPSVAGTAAAGVPTRSAR
mmetsp:Transcript_7546/g.17617  ORF Transcript_7546/g.17617 Transcript_7546/m.17617 type:complete len:220 (-) Transcript_7546:1333-1992(-)